MHALKAAKSLPVTAPSSGASSSIGSESGPLMVAEISRGGDIAEPPPTSREGKRKAAAQSEVNIMTFMFGRH